MKQTTVITARLDEALAADLDKLAGALDRSRSWIIARAIERYVKEEGEFIAFIQEGEDDIAAGRVHSQDEVEAMFLHRIGRRDAA